MKVHPFIRSLINDDLALLDGTELHRVPVQAPLYTTRDGRVFYLYRNRLCERVVKTNRKNNYRKRCTTGNVQGQRYPFVMAQGVMFVYMGTNMYVKAIARALHFDEYKEFEYTADGMKDAWASGIKASSAYYERMAQYNQDTRGMTKEERNNYYRDRNKEDGWFRR